jgi:hypothetical protein
MTNNSNRHDVSMKQETHARVRAAAEREGLTLVEALDQLINDALDERLKMPGKIPSAPMPGEPTNG